MHVRKVSKPILTFAKSSSMLIKFIDFFLFYKSTESFFVLSEDANGVHYKSPTKGISGFYNPHGAPRRN